MSTSHPDTRCTVYTGRQGCGEIGRLSRFPLRPLLFHSIRFKKATLIATQEIDFTTCQWIQAHSLRTVAIKFLGSAKGHASHRSNIE